MSWRTTETLTTVREVADEPRTIEGMAVPYGQVAIDTELGREAFAPGAFRASVEHWMSRQDGARMAYRPAHKQDPVGVVTRLEEMPDGVRFRAVIDEDPEGDKYLRRVRSGLNGVSVEAGLPRDSRRTRDGTVLHREARLHAIAGSTSPAYDGARIALRDMEDPMDTETTETSEATPERDAAATAVAPIPPAEREARERTDATVQRISTSGISITRDAFVYGFDATWSGRDERGQRFSLLSDGWKAKQGDGAAAERLYRYSQARDEYERQAERDAKVMERAGDVLSSEIPGAYPNDYIPGLLTPRILKGRPMGGFFNRFPISDGLPKIFPKVTTSTSVAVQSAEGANPAASDFATTAVTATPLLYGAETVVSRQVLDGSSPAAEAMLLQDMMEAYAQASETVIKTAVEAGATASGTAITAATPFAGTLGNVIAYFTARFRGAGAQFVPSALYAVLLAQPDTTGRPLLPSIGAINSSGTTADGGSGAGILGASTFLSYASTTNVVVTGAANDYVIFESPIARFSYDAVTGPSGVRVGIWAYLVVGTRLGSLKVTAA
jgi:HK97 family phage prohead protease